MIHVPGASKSFQCQVDLSDLEFYGTYPIVHSVQVQGRVTNHAGALNMEGQAVTVLELRCDRCGRFFQREQQIALDFPLSETPDEEKIQIKDGELDLDQIVSDAFILGMDTKNLCTDQCKGICIKCGANLNDGPCQCQPEPDPRWSALARLLNQDQEVSKMRN